jgi:hypothetical protein
MGDVLVPEQEQKREGADAQAKSPSHAVAPSPSPGPAQAQAQAQAQTREAPSPLPLPSTQQKTQPPMQAQTHALTSTSIPMQHQPQGQRGNEGEGRKDDEKLKEQFINRHFATKLSIDEQIARDCEKATVPIICKFPLVYKPGAIAEAFAMHKLVPKPQDVPQTKDEAKESISFAYCKNNCKNLRK